MSDAPYGDVICAPDKVADPAQPRDDSAASVSPLASAEPDPGENAAASPRNAQRPVVEPAEIPVFLSNMRTLENIPLQPTSDHDEDLSAAANLRTMEDAPVSIANLRTMEDAPFSAANLRTMEDAPVSIANLRTMEDVPAAASDLRTLAYPVDGFTIDDAKNIWGRAAANGGHSGLTLKTGEESLESSIFMTISNTVRLRASRLTTGQELGGGDFVLAKLLGKGGMGMVFTAKQTSLNRNVAIKVIRPEAVSDSVAKAKFVTEAILTGGLDHPNIIPIHDLGQTDDGGVFYAMKEVKGRGWNDRLPEMSEEDNVNILLRVADAMAFAHDNGIIHRDLKPENIMLGDYGEVLVMDWGIATPYRPDAEGRKPAMGTAGTPAYMAPEMANGDDSRMGPATDIYLLGAILYEITTGLRAHSGENIYECLANAANNVIPKAEKSGELVNIALRAMASEPADRFANMKEFQKAIQDCQRHQESELLVRRAEDSLEQAAESGLYSLFAKAVFGYEEALAIWPDNSKADAGQRRARLAYAERAIAQGDCDLAMEAVEPLPESDSRRMELHEAAAKAKRQIDEQRLARRRWQRVAVGMVCLVVATLAVGVTLVYRQMLIAQAEERRALSAEARAVANLREAERQRQEAEKQKAEAEFQRGAAKENEVRAMRSAELAAAEADNARQAEAEALRQKDMAQTARDEAIMAQQATELARQAENNANQRTIVAMQQREEEEKFRRQAQEEARRRTEEAARLGVLTDASLWAIDSGRAVARQTNSARAAGRPASLDASLGAGEKISFRWLPVGDVVNGNTFVMGSPPDEPGRAADEFLHPVTLTRPVYLAATELTRGQWKAVLGDENADELEKDRLLVQAGTDEWRASWQWRVRPLRPEERELPATGISLRDVRDRLLPALASRAPAGHAFRIPSEAEWECAARAGTITPFASGADPKGAEDMAWVMTNSGDSPHPVGLLKPNAWGFYDMHGNASEMTADLYDRDFYLAGGLLPDPLNDARGRRHAARGGAYMLDSNFARSAARSECHEANRFEILGVRLALEPTRP